jgi:ATP-binding cassette subfamily F protein uup
MQLDIAEYIDLGKGKKWTASQLLTLFYFLMNAAYPHRKLSGGEKRRLYLCSILMQTQTF